MLERFLENFLANLRAAQKVYIERITAGSPKTLEEYKFVVGKLKGIEESEVLAKQTYDALVDMRSLKEHRERDYEEQFNNELY